MIHSRFLPSSRRSLSSSLRSNFAAIVSCLALLAGMVSMPAHGQSISASVTPTTVTVGTNPQGVAVNPVTGKTYVANYGSGWVTVFGGPVGSYNIYVGAKPDAVAVDPATNKIYVANDGGTTVSVIDGSTNAVTSVSVGANPAALAVDPVTNKIYVANDSSTGTVSVIDGSTNAVTSVSVGANPDALAVDPVTNKIYVANYSGSVSVIDGANDTVTATIAADASPTVIAVNPVTDKVYVASSSSDLVDVIDGSTDSASASSPISVGIQLNSLAVNPVTDKIYVTNYGATGNANMVTVINGATDTVSGSPITVGTGPTAVAVNLVTNQVFVSNYGNGVGNTVSIIDASNNNSVSTVTVGTGPQALAVNPVTDNVVVANDGTSDTGNTVSVIDGSKNMLASSVSCGCSSGYIADPIAVNPVTNKVYVVNHNLSTVSVIDGANNVSTVTVANGPDAVAVNPVTDKIYVMSENGSNPPTPELTVIDGANNTTTTIPMDTYVSSGFGFTPIAVNPVTDKIYVAGPNSTDTTNQVEVIDGANNSVIGTVTLGSGKGQEAAIAVEPVTDKVYVTNVNAGTVSVIDGATDTLTQTIQMGSGSNPTAIAIEPASHNVYVSVAGGVSVIAGVKVVDPVTGTKPAGTILATIPLGGTPADLAVNPVTEKVYANLGSTVPVILGVQLWDTVNTGISSTYNYQQSIAVNPVTNKVYVVNAYNGGNGSGNKVLVIDGASDTLSNTLSLPVTGVNTAVLNPVTGKVYVTSNISPAKVSVIDSEGLQTVPITMTAAGVSDLLTTSQTNAPVFQTMNTQPSFTVTATSAYSSSSTYSSLTATDPPPTALYYAVDGGNVLANNGLVWTETPPTGTTGSTATFTVAPGTLTPGFHTLYYYTAYGNEGGQNSSAYGTSNASGNAPEISNIKAMYFLVETMSTTTSVTADVNPQNSGSSVTFTATVTPNPNSNISSTLSGSVQFYDGTTALGSPVTVQNSGGVYQATYSTSSLAAGSHTINAIYSGDPNYAASSGSITEKIAGTASVIAVTSGGGQSAPVGTAFTNPVVVTVQDSNGIAVPGATVNFSGTGLSYSPATASTDSSGQASTTATPTQGGGLTGTATVGGTSVSKTFSETGTLQTPTVKVQTASTGYGTTTTTLTATISYTGTTAPTGAISFKVGSGSTVAGSCTGSTSPLTCTSSYPTATLAISGSPYTITATLAADGNFNSASGTGSLTVTKATPVITWPAPAAITYGTALSATQLDATATNSGSTVAGTFTYSPASGTVLSAGPQTLSVTFTPSDTTDYNTATGSVSLTVNPAPLKVTANNATKVYNTANPTFTGSVTGAVNGDTFTETFSTTATTTSNAGTYPITPSVTGTNLSDYTVATTNGTLTVTKAATAVALTTSVSNANLNASVTFTATVTSQAGTPTGSVQFLDGSTVLGSGQVNNNGVATYTTSSLAAGLHQITAVYQGDVNFQQSTSAALAQTVTAPDFGLTSNKNSLTLKEGQTGQFTISMEPVGGFKGSVQFTCSGLPTLAQCAFSPSMLTADGSNTTQTSTLTITTKGSATGTVSMMTHPNQPDGTMLAGLFWLPALFFGGFLFWQRKKLSQKYRVLLILLVAAATISGAVGCGSAMPHTAPGTSTVVVTGTSGANTQTVTVYVDVTK